MQISNVATALALGGNVAYVAANTNSLATIELFENNDCGGEPAKVVELEHDSQCIPLDKSYGSASYTSHQEDHIHNFVAWSGEECESKETSLHWATIGACNTPEDEGAIRAITAYVLGAPRDPSRNPDGNPGDDKPADGEDNQEEDLSAGLEGRER